MHSPWRTKFFKDEFDGESVGFAGGSLAHGALCTRPIAAFEAAGRPGGRVSTSNVAISIGDFAYVSSDFAYSCEAFVGTATALVAPLVAGEVVSPHRSRRDRVGNVAAYGRLPSLRE